jgi:hypothetical protein
LLAFLKCRDAREGSAVLALNPVGYRCLRGLEMSEVADPGAEARKVFIRLVETHVSWGICVVQNVRVLMGIKPL